MGRWLSNLADLARGSRSHGNVPVWSSILSRWVPSTPPPAPAIGGGLVYVNTTIPAGNTVSNSTSETAFSSSYTIPAATMAVGKFIRIKLRGTYGSALLLPGNITGKIKFGSTVIVSTGAIPLTLNLSDLGWFAEVEAFVTADGAGGAVEAQASVGFSTAASASLSFNPSNTAPISVDWSASKAITATVQFSSAQANNTITLRQMAVEIISA